ncbi:Mu transposase C-terminal domain-containing protein [Bosea sp. NPDC055353]
MTNALNPTHLVHSNGRAPQWNLSHQDKITIDGVDYSPATYDWIGHVLRRVDNPNLHESFTHEEFHALRQAGRLSIDPGFYKKTKAKLRLPNGASRLTDLSPKTQIKVLWRKTICDRILKLEAEGKVSRSDKSLKAAVNQIVAELLTREFANGRCGSADVFVKRPPSPRALRRWLRKYEACHYDAMAFVDGWNRCGDRKSVRFGAEERALMAKYADMYMSTRKPKKSDLLHDLHAEIDRQNEDERGKQGLRFLNKPSRKAFERVINALDPFAVEAGRTSPEAARKKFFIVRGGLEVTRPLERLEIDETLIPLQAILIDAGIWETLTPKLKDEVRRGRYWLSAAIDAASRCYTAALLVEKLTASTAVATLEMAVNDKSGYAAAAGCLTPWDMYGSPESVVQDSGSQFLSHEYCSAVTDLGAELLFPPAGLPQLRGRKERGFRTLNGLFSRLDGQTFGNVVAKGDYNAEARATLDIAEIGRMIVRWIVDVYHNRPHSGLGGETPRNAWLRLSRDFPVLPNPDPDKNRHIFGITLERRIGNEGIRVLGLRYQNLQLQRLRADFHQKPVLVRVNPADLGKVSVRTQEGWCEVPCMKSGFDGVSVTRWLEAESLLRRRNASMTALALPVVQQAVRDIQETADQAARRAGIASPILGSAEIAKFEKARFRDFEIASDTGDAPAIFEPMDELEPPTAAEDIASSPDVLPDGDFFMED